MGSSERRRTGAHRSGALHRWSSAREQEKTASRPAPPPAVAARTGSRSAGRWERIVQRGSALMGSESVESPLTAVRSCALVCAAYSLLKSPCGRASN